MEAIYKRRSIRRYQDKPITREHIEKILKAGMNAPSAGNEQPWHFVVMTERAKLDAVVSIHHYAAMAAHAPLAIMVCGDLTLEKYNGFWVQDCSAAMQNLLLAVHAKGLGAVWCGVYPVAGRITGFRALLNLPEHIIPLGLAVIGRTTVTPVSKKRFRPERVHNNVW